jgi:hypothetical protein
LGAPAREVPVAVLTLLPFGLAAVLAAEPGAGVCVVEIGPATAPEVSDVLALARVDEPVVLLFAADAEFALPLQATVAAAASTNETRTERYIFPSCC